MAETKEKEDKETEAKKTEKEEMPERAEEIEEEATTSDKDTKKLVIMILSFLAILLIIFIVSKYLYAYYSTPEYPQYTYNGFEFVKIAGLWHTKWQKDNNLYSVRLRYGPKESEDIPFYEEGAPFTPTGKIYITFDPGQGKKYVALAGTELSLSLANTFNITPVAACTKNETGCSTRPIITCDNTEDAVIYIKEATPPSITARNNCLIIQGDGENLVRAADKVLWIWYGIIK